MPTYSRGKVLVGTAAAAAGSNVGSVTVNFIGATSLLRFAASEAGLSKLELETTCNEVIVVVVVVAVVAVIVDGRSTRNDDVTMGTDEGLRWRCGVTSCSNLSRPSGDNT
jgi:hypothetical protein